MFMILFFFSFWSQFKNEELKIMHAQKQGYRANALPNKKHTIAQKRY